MGVILMRFQAQGLFSFVVKPLGAIYLISEHGCTSPFKNPDIQAVPYCHCIHRIASGGYYGFRFVTLAQCVERFHCYCSNEKNIIPSLLKFAVYIHNHKILPGNFGLILKNKMAATGILQLSARSFVGSLEQRVL